MTAAPESSKLLVKGDELKRLLQIAAETEFKINYDAVEKLVGVEVEGGCRIVATQDIKAGSVIYTGQPLIKFEMKEDDPLGLGLQMLSNATKDKLLALTSGLSPSTEEDIIKRINWLGSGLSTERTKNLAHEPNVVLTTRVSMNQFHPEGDVRTLYLIGSKFNHSCAPSCYNLFDSDHVMSMYAMRDLVKGDECSFMYFAGDPEVTVAQDAECRRAFIMKRMGFLCTCIACTGKTQLRYTDLMRHFPGSGGVHGLARMATILMDAHCCRRCGVKGSKTCVQCKAVIYCSKTCQRLHWRTHKKQCTPPKT
ncbi:Hypothetical protein POVN_LOCUS739 [uncultured virus]|nr:Hypothetical protein POVN_LOCUS739 [uncultured virus]